MYHENYIENDYNPLLIGFESKEEIINLATLRGTSQLGFRGHQSASGTPHPATPLTLNPPPYTFPPPPPPPPLRVMANEVKIPIFRGEGSEDPEKFWFVVEVLWKS